MTAWTVSGGERPQGLYSPSDEHDACGVGFVANIKGARSHRIVRSALDLLINLEHRGACGSDPGTGDGAGILIQMPDRFFRKTVSFALPPAGSYGAGLVFLPHDATARNACKATVERIVTEEGQSLLGWREVPIDLDKVGRTAASVAPVFEQLFIASRVAGARRRATEAFERKLYIIRKLIERATPKDVYICGLSSKTLIYKGMLTASQIEGMFPDLSTPPSNPRSRSSTSASRPTLFRRGRWRIRIASSRTTARSTRYAATSTG